MWKRFWGNYIVNWKADLLSAAMATRSPGWRPPSLESPAARVATRCAKWERVWTLSSQAMVPLRACSARNVCPMCAPRLLLMFLPRFPTSPKRSGKPAAAPTSTCTLYNNCLQTASIPNLASPLFLTRLQQVHLLTFPDTSERSSRIAHFHSSRRRRPVQKKHKRKRITESFKCPPTHYSCHRQKWFQQGDTIFLLWFHNSRT